MERHQTSHNDCQGSENGFDLPTTPPFDAAYAVAPAPPFIAMRLLTLMTQPR